MEARVARSQLPASSASLRSRLRWTAALTGLGLLVSCQVSPGDPPVQPEVDEASSLRALEDLMELPSAEDMEARYEALSSSVRDALDDELGSLEWEVEPRVRPSGACADVPAHLGGVVAQVTSRAPSPVIDDETWTRVVAVVAAAVGASGFEDIGVVAEQAGSRQHLFADGDAQIVIYANSALAVDVSSGCVLREDDRAATERYGVPDPAYWNLLYPDSTVVPAERLS